MRSAASPARPKSRRASIDRACAAPRPRSAISMPRSITLTDDLQHRGDDAAAAGRAGDQERLAVLEHDRRRHRRQRPLARAGRVGVAADQPIGVRRVRLGGEIVELVVEQDAGAVGDEAEPVAEVERVGVRDRVAETVHHGEMRRVAALRRPAARGRISPAGVARAGSIVARHSAAWLFDGQARERHLDDVGVAEEPGAVRVSALHRFGHQEQRLRIALVREIVAFEDVEHLDQHDAARGGRRHRDDVVAAIGAAHGRAFDRAIILEIVGGHDAAGGLHRSSRSFPRSGPA